METKPTPNEKFFRIGAENYLTFEFENIKTQIINKK
jgi:hypothetical protein